ncbi:hypothetical protein [Natrononativus amylolyticus]|uniref:hypothetical protein n=1 Tax=Natrononativus amylolyticus TaxID=2963434 RepID=UPI0020CDD27E|nr:hypothetical protein [Natrononativus amylolyticus]
MDTDRPRLIVSDELHPFGDEQPQFEREDAALRVLFDVLWTDSEIRDECTGSIVDNVLVEDPKFTVDRIGTKRQHCPGKTRTLLQKPPSITSSVSIGILFSYHVFVDGASTRYCSPWNGISASRRPSSRRGSGATTGCGSRRDRTDRA